MQNNKPKILYFDCETSPNLTFVWRLGKQYVGMDQIHKERKVTCICYKWAGEKTIHSLQMNLSKHDLGKKDDDADRQMLVDFCKVYAQADLTVAQNGIKFDIAFIRSRLVKFGLPDIKPVILDDTYLASKGIGFNSHKLDYLAQHFGLGKKASHPYSLWVDVMGGSQKALTDTVKYCKQDVNLLEKVYNNLLPYIKSKLNRATFAQDIKICPSCGVDALVKNGHSMSVTGIKRVVLCCKACGKHCTSGTGKSIENGSQYPR